MGHVKRCNPLTPVEVTELRAVFENSGVIRNLEQLVEVLCAGPQSAFSESDISGIRAVGKLMKSSWRPAWQCGKSRGRFFVFEGLDRSGKSTQSRLLAKHLGARTSVTWMCFPDRTTPVGMLINLYLQNELELSDEVIHMLFSANRWEAMETILGELQQGISIVCDRFAFSGCAYSAAKGLDMPWCMEPDRGLISPDCVFFLDVSETVGMARTAFGDERYEKGEFQASVRKCFKCPSLRHGVKWIDIDAARDIDSIHTEIIGMVDTVYQGGDGDQFSSLWSMNLGSGEAEGEAERRGKSGPNPTIRITEQEKEKDVALGGGTSTKKMRVAESNELQVP